MTAIKSFQVAHYILAKSNQVKTISKLMKIMYIGHGFSLALKPRALITEGCQIGVIYVNKSMQMKINKANHISLVNSEKYHIVIPSISQLIKDCNNDFNKFKQTLNSVEYDSLLEFEKHILDYVIKSYGDIDEVKLINAITKNGTPFSITHNSYINNKQNKSKSKFISDDLICHFYRSYIINKSHDFL